MQYRWFDRLTMTFVILSLSKDKDAEIRQEDGAHRGGEYRFFCNILIFNMFSVVYAVNF